MRLALAASLAAISGFAPAAGAVELTPIGAFAEPTYVVAPPSDEHRLLVVERGGKVKLLLNGRLQPRPFLDLSRLVGSFWYEQGLLSLAFAPDYARSRRLYVAYTDRRGNSRIEEYRARTRNSAALSTRRLLLRLRKPSFWDHNGGQLQFGPDGYLYTGFGDGGHHRTEEDYVKADPDRNALDLRTLFGKLIRIDPRPVGRRAYRIPPSNPFVGRRDARPEIFASGFRNPWRFSFDRGSIAIGDAGEQQRDEITFVSLRRARGANFGWSAYEGTLVFNADQLQKARGAIMPTIEYGRERGCAIIGGYVVRDRSSSLYGRYVYGDYCSHDIRSFQPGAPQTDATSLTLPTGGVHSFGLDARQRLYVATQTAVYRLR